jgi:hypothetical protein
MEVKLLKKSFNIMVFFLNSENSTFFFPEEKIALAMQLELLKESILEEIKTNKKKI